MPINDFKCNSCGKEFMAMQLTGTEDKDIKCSFCRENNCTKLEPLMAHNVCSLRGGG